jgi:hypothetical protein
MADATSTFVVRGQADVDDAVRGLNKVGESAKDAGNKAETFGEKVRTAATGLIAGETAMAAFAKATEFATEAVRAAIAADEGLTTAAGQVTGAIDGLKVQLGNIVIGGENGATAMFNLADILLDLSDALGGAGEEGGIALIAVNALKDGLIGLTYVVDAGALAWAALKTGVDVIIGSLVAAGQGVIGISNALADLAQIFVGGAIEAFAGLLEGTVNLAESLGAGGLLPEGARASVQSIRELGQSIGEGMDPMERLRVAGGEIAGTFDLVRDNATETVDGLRTFFGTTSDLRDGLRDSRTEIDLGTTSTRTYTGAVREAQQAVEEWAFTELEAAEIFGMQRPEIAQPRAPSLSRPEGDQLDSEGLREYIGGIETASEAMEGLFQTKTKLTAAAGAGEDGGGFFDVEKLSKDYDVMEEATTAFEGTASGLGSSLSSSFGAALSSTEDFGKAFKQALGQALVSQGISEILTGISNMIPFGPQFNPAAGTARLAAGGAMLAAGKLMGGKGSAPPGGGGGGGGGGRSAGESSGLSPMSQSQAPRPLSLVDYTGVTIVTNDTDSMRTLIDRQTQTAATGGMARV